MLKFFLDQHETYKIYKISRTDKLMCVWYKCDY